MVRTLLILAVLVIGCAQVGSLNVTCKTDQFTRCLSTFTTNLNLTTATPYKNGQKFRSEIENYYAKGSTNSLLNLCRAFRQLKECMGYDYGECVSVSNLVLTGLSTVQQAYDFVSVFNQQHFVCSAGLVVYLQNEECFAGTWRDRRQYFDACYTQFFADVVAEDTKTICNASKDLSSCLQFGFFDSCSAIRGDAMWWGCEYGRILAATQYPQCNHTCTNQRIIGI